MSDLVVMGRDWSHHLVELVQATRDDLLVCSPYVTSAGCTLIRSNMTERFEAAGQVTILTDLSPIPICQGSTDPAALRLMTQGRAPSAIRHLPRLHAKVYIGDAQAAIITSGNLTSGGLVENYEYGVRISEPSVVRAIRSDLAAFAALGAVVSDAQLVTYCDIAHDVRKAFRQAQAGLARSVRHRFEALLRQAEDELVRMRLAGGALHTVFARTILYLLRTFGPPSTVDIHQRMQAIHPDLCDGSIDRVIDGKHFGKKWKHAARTAQQHLKKQELVELREGRWHLVSG
jgi:phosphatidylserine/phosphatidylglycerophosphate/cardiolipin synthase-like enzyme